MKIVSAKEIQDRLGVDVELERRKKQTLDRLCQFLHRVAEIGVRSRSVGLDGSVPVDALIRQGFRHPEAIAARFIDQHTVEYPLDGAHLKLYGGFFWDAAGKRWGSIELIGRESRANHPHFSQEVDELIAQFFPQRD